MSSSKITEELKKANITEQVLAGLKENFLPIVVLGIHDEENYLKAKEAKKACVTVRTTTEKLCKKGREDAIAEQKAWIAKEKEIVAEVRAVEDHLAAQMKIVDDEKDRVAEEKRRKDLLPEKKLRLNGLEHTLTDEAILSMTDQEFFDNLQRLVDAKAVAETKRLAQIRIDRFKELSEIGLFFNGSVHYRGDYQFVMPTDDCSDETWASSLESAKEAVTKEVEKEIAARTEEESRKIELERTTVIPKEESPALYPTKPEDAISPEEQRKITIEEPSAKVAPMMALYLDGTKLFFLDLETTGTLPYKHGIHQISGSVWINGEKKEEFDFKVKPNEKAVIDPFALEIGGVTEEQIKTYPPMKEVYIQITELLGRYVDKFNKTDKFHIVGYNNRGFDDQFFRGFFLQNMDEYFGSWFWADSHDVLVMASVHLMKVRKTMKDFKLATVAKEMGIVVDESKLHDASYDIALTEQLYLSLIG